MKPLPLDKTIVLEYTITVADISAKRRRCKTGISVKVPQTSALVEADANVSNLSPVTLSNVGAFLSISSNVPITIALTSGANTTTLSSSGTFLFTGVLDAVVITGLNTAYDRITYIYA